MPSFSSQWVGSRSCALGLSVVKPHIDARFAQPIPLRALQLLMVEEGDMSKTAFQQGYGPALLFPDTITQAPSSHEQISREMHILAAAHKLSIENATHFNLLSQALSYENLLIEQDALPRDENFLLLKQLSIEVADFALRDNAPVALTHRAFLLTNSAIECDEASIKANAGYRYADYATDFATYAVTRNLKTEDIRYALEEYLERQPLLWETRHFWAMIGLAGWTSYLWCLIESERAGAPTVMEGKCVYYANTFLEEALRLYLAE